LAAEGGRKKKRTHQRAAEGETFSSIFRGKKRKKSSSLLEKASQRRGGEGKKGERGDAISAPRWESVIPPCIVKKGQNHNIARRRARDVLYFNAGKKRSSAAHSADPLARRRKKEKPSGANGEIA